MPNAINQKSKRVLLSSVAAWWARIGQSPLRSKCDRGQCMLETNLFRITKADRFFLFFFSDSIQQCLGNVQSGTSIACILCVCVCVCERVALAKRVCGAIAFAVNCYQIFFTYSFVSLANQLKTHTHTREKQTTANANGERMSSEHLDRIEGKWANMNEKIKWFIVRIFWHCAFIPVYSDKFSVLFVLRTSGATGVRWKRCETKSHGVLKCVCVSWSGGRKASIY